MDPMQEQFEKAVGDAFIEWLNDQTGSAYCFARRADQAPDLVYVWNGAELLIEVTAAYYDKDHAKFLWQGARGDKDAPGSWLGAEPDKSLAAAISQRVADKSLKRYGRNSVLLVDVPPGVTTAKDLERLLRDQPTPETPFTGIYVVGRFPISSDSSGGYRVIPLKQIPVPSAG